MGLRRRAVKSSRREGGTEDLQRGQDAIGVGAEFGALDREARLRVVAREVLELAGSLTSVAAREERLEEERECVELSGERLWIDVISSDGDDG